MNFSCVICSDLFNHTSEVYVTPCGHLFHHFCLLQWIERSKTCPQCRCKVTQNNINRVFFNVHTTEGIQEDAVTLLAKVDSLQFQLTLKNRELSRQSEKHDAIKSQNVVLREEIKEFDQKLKVCESSISALKQQVSYFKNKAKESDRLQEEVIKLKTKIEELENVQLVIDGNTEQIEDMLRYNKDVNSLAVMVITLKKALIKSDQQKRDLEANIKKSQNNAKHYKRKNAEFERKIAELSFELEYHNKNCEHDRQLLKKKISSLMDRLAESPNSSIKRIVTESPAPSSNKLDNNSAIVIKESPTILEKVNAIKESFSPYVNIKLNGMGSHYMQLMKKPLQTTTNKINFKSEKSVTSGSNDEVAKSDYSYDGLGGHCKNELFPEGRSTVTLKRHKTMTSLKSVKFRKLADPKLTKKIDSFLSKNES